MVVKRRLLLAISVGLAVAMIGRPRRRWVPTAASKPDPLVAERHHPRPGHRRRHARPRASARSWRSGLAEAAKPGRALRRPSARTAGSRTVARTARCRRFRGRRRGQPRHLGGRLRWPHLGRLVVNVPGRRRQRRGRAAPREAYDGRQAGQAFVTDAPDVGPHRQELSIACVGQPPAGRRLGRDQLRREPRQAHDPQPRAARRDRPAVRRVFGLWARRSPQGGITVDASNDAVHVDLDGRRMKENVLYKRFLIGDRAGRPDHTGERHTRLARAG